MLRPLLAILLLGLLVLAPVAGAATSEGTIRAILRDCEDDGQLGGSYRPSELRDAVRNIGTDLDQYSDCRDVIGAAVFRGAGPGGSGGSDGSNGGAGGTSGGSGASAGGDPAGAGSGGGDGGFSGGGPLLVPGTPQERSELDLLRTSSPPRSVIAGRPLSFGASGPLSADVAHEIPVPLIVALGLLTAGALLASLPALRRRIVDRRSSTA